MNINFFMIINVIPQQNLWHRDGYEKRLVFFGLPKCPVKKNFCYKSPNWNLNSATSAQPNGNYLD